VTKLDFIHHRANTRAPTSSGLFISTKEERDGEKERERVCVIEIVRENERPGRERQV
jgi:hypothetical protein